MLKNVRSNKFVELNARVDTTLSVFFFSLQNPNAQPETNSLIYGQIVVREKSLFSNPLFRQL